MRISKRRKHNKFTKKSRKANKEQRFSITPYSSSLESITEMQPDIQSAQECASHLPQSIFLFSHQKTRTYHIDVARILGLAEACLLQQLYYWMEKLEHSPSHNKADHVWVYNTYEEWNKQVPLGSKFAVQRCFDSLRAKGVVLTGNFNQSKADRTNWYTINFAALEMLMQTASNESASGLAKSPHEETTQEIQVSDQENTEKQTTSEIASPQAKTQEHKRKRPLIPLDYPLNNSLDVSSSISSTDPQEKKNGTEKVAPPILSVSSQYKKVTRGKQQQVQADARLLLLLGDMAEDLSRDLGNIQCVKSNITQIVRLYNTASITEEDFLIALYTAKNQARGIANIKYKNEDGSINRMPVFFACLKQILDITTGMEDVGVY